VAKVVSEVLGHKEIAITLDRYSHALPTMQANAMARLDAILGRGDDTPPIAASDKGSNKGSPAAVEAKNRPNPSVDPAEIDEIGTAYPESRLTSGGSRLSTVVTVGSGRLRDRIASGHLILLSRHGHLRLALPFGGRMAA
jgi:hypothetical protein